MRKEDRRNPDIMNMNNRKRRGRMLLFLLALCTFTLLFGCGATGNEETPEITPDYLSDTYSQQLINDGAEKLLGSMELSRSDAGDIQVVLHPKEIVSDDTQEKGYRIDSFALSRTLTLPEQAYITYLPDGETTDPRLLTPDQFFQTLEEDYMAHGNNFAEYGDHRLYDVYALDDQILLIMAHPL